jgi:hypothetical protein
VIVEGQIWMTALLVPEAMVTSSNLPLATPISLYWTLPRCTRSRLLAGARVPGTLEGVSATSLTDKRNRPPPVGNVNTPFTRRASTTQLRCLLHVTCPHPLAKNPRR